MLIRIFAFLFFFYGTCVANFSQIVDEKGQVSDAVVALLNVTGVAVQGVPSIAFSDKVARLLTLSDRSVETVMRAVQGKMRENFSWRGRGERWAFQYPLTLTVAQAQEVIRIMYEELRFADVVLPKKDRYTSVLFLGSTLSIVRERLNFLNFYSHLVSFKQIDIVSGVRSLSSEAGERVTDFLTPSSGLPILRPQTGKFPTNEIEMILYVFAQSQEESQWEKPLFVINGAVHQGLGLTRATTQSSIEAWYEMNRHTLKGSSYLLISNAPYIYYQHLVALRTLLQQGVPFKMLQDMLETAGPALDRQACVNENLIKQAQILLSNLASLLYELCLIKEKITPEEFKNLVTALS